MKKYLLGIMAAIGLSVISEAQYYTAWYAQNPNFNSGLYTGSLYVGSSKANANFTVTNGGVFISSASGSILNNLSVGKTATMTNAVVTSSISVNGIASLGYGSVIGSLFSAGVGLSVSGQNNTNFAGGYPFNMVLIDTAGANGDVGGGMVFAGDDGSSPSRWFSGIHGGKENATLTNYSGYLSFHTRVNGGALIERARISSSGNLGVGTTMPAQILDVVGNGAISNNLSVGQTFTTKDFSMTGTTVSFKSVTISSITNGSPEGLNITFGSSNQYVKIGDSAISGLVFSRSGGADPFVWNNNADLELGVATDHTVAKIPSITMKYNGPIYFNPAQTLGTAIATMTVTGVALSVPVVPPSKTIAQLKLITPTLVGEIYYCSDSSPASIYLSTGTGQYAFVKASTGNPD